MLLFLLRCTFWLALVAMALPWFAVDNTPTGATVAASRPVAAKPPMVARAAEAQRYFDDATGSLGPASGCAKDECGDGDAAKVDLIALQLGAAGSARAKPAPAKAASTKAAPTMAALIKAAAAPSPRPAAHREARRPANIGDLLAR